MLILPKTKPIVTMTIYFIVLFLSALNVKAQQTSYANLSQLQNDAINSEQDAERLLTSEDFYQQLVKLAKALPEAIVSEQSTFTQTALRSIRQEQDKLNALIAKQQYPLEYYHYQLFHQAKNNSQRSQNFELALTAQFNQQLQAADNEQLYKLDAALGWSVNNALNYVFNVFKQLKDNKSLNEAQVIQLVSNSEIYHVVAQVIPVTKPLLAAENQKRYIIEPDVLITTKDGIEHSATIVRSKTDKQKRPTAFQFTIYADERSHIRTATHAAAHGYVGIVANTRGKRNSNNVIVPWEHEGKDATRLIDWISKQDWSDGRVVMYGGSYNGFTQWAAAKYHHPALKAIAPYTAANLATGLPMENNIFLTANYQWSFHVTNNKTMDQSVYGDWQYWNNLYQELFTSGRAFKEIDELAGKANLWFQKWLSHPSYDEYYQQMVPYGKDYLNINIPVLTVTGYYDGGQISAIDFMTEHYRHNPNANHSLLIGPYNHWSAQNIPRSHLGNYQLDKVALEKDTEETVFAWFDHLLYSKEKPALVQNKVNYQLMGSNTWQFADSYQAMNANGIDFYLAAPKKGQFQILGTTKPNTIASHQQVVDMADRSVQHNLDAVDIISDQLAEQTGIVFLSQPFEQDMQYAGAPTGYFSIAVNKKDVDIGFNLYHIQADGKAFHLTHYRSRASYAKDMSNRQLLTPDQKTTIPLINARMNAKLMEKGSRIALVLDVNKNHTTQVNMGTGKDVSIETIEDAGEKLNLKWFTDSVIHLPVTPFNYEH
ncbi:CocE/NonD family hydrolase [Thalassotalea marina]|uniref:Xaa-Pro dipeptidyl-peptidase C-terminal domain-containing protein n=1 Tax=Thalassotalea marina TaxID=1673741 RepID=A0A919BMB4_9GAMM|nr:CocE/NonD family hydrolase [Thalassotalea marina]GHF99075.1 hypothetical protein GCM10017161_29300 [Thalassotalea marina]